MRQIVYTIIGYIAFQLVVPRLWERLLTEAPDWLLRLGIFAFTTLCLILIVGADPLYVRLWNPRQYPIGSTLIVMISTAAFGALIWSLFILRVVPGMPHTAPKNELAPVGQTSKTETPKSEEIVKDAMPPVATVGAATEPTAVI